MFVNQAINIAIQVKKLLYWLHLTNGSILSSLNVPTFLPQLSIQFHGLDEGEKIQLKLDAEVQEPLQMLANTYLYANSNAESASAGV